MVVVILVKRRSPDAKDTYAPCEYNYVGLKIM